MPTPTKDETQSTEAPRNPSSFAGGFPLQDVDIFSGEGTRGEEVELDEEALAKQAGVAKQDKSKSQSKPPKKKRFGFG